MSRFFGIEPGIAHAHPATQASDVEPDAGHSPQEPHATQEAGLEEPVIEAPGIGGNCFSSDFWAHQQDLMHAGAASNPEMASMKLGLDSYNMGASMAQEMQSEAMVAPADAVTLDQDVGAQFQEARRIDYAAAGMVGGAGEGAMPSASAAAASPNATSGREAGRSGGGGRTEQAASAGQGEDSPVFSQSRVSASHGGTLNFRQLDKALAGLFGDKKMKFECVDCGGAESPPEASAAAGKSTARAQQSGFDASFFARKSQQS